METDKMPSIIAKMQIMRDSMTRSGQSVVDYIIANPEEVIYASVDELAEHCKVSEPSVIRACKKLGFSGYQELKITLAREMVNPLQSIATEDAIAPGDGPPVIAAKIFKSIINSLNFTFDTLSIPDIVRTAQALASARRIIIMGVGNSNAISVDLQHKLMRLGFTATAYSDPHMATIAVSYMDSRDVVFCISHSGSSIEVVDIATQGKAKGALVISITNIGISPLSKVSDIALHTASNETKYRIVGFNSRIAQLAIVDVLYATISLHLNREEDLRVEDSLSSHKF